MKPRQMSITVLCVAALVAGCSGAGVRSDAEAINLTGTVWAGATSDGDSFIFRFKPGGQLHFTHHGVDYQESCDTWTQEGNKFIVSLTDGFAMYRGEIHGDVIRGEIRNIRNETWQFEFKRQIPSPSTHPIQ